MKLTKVYIINGYLNETDAKTYTKLLQQKEKLDEKLYPELKERKKLIKQRKNQRPNY